MAIDTPVAGANPGPLHTGPLRPGPLRPGPLRNGNPRGNPQAAARCGAHTRAGDLCRQPAMPNGRCRLHGGHATGPRTCAGRAAVAAAHTTHGHYGAESRAFLAAIDSLLRAAPDQPAPDQPAHSRVTPPKPAPPPFTNRRNGDKTQSRHNCATRQLQSIAKLRNV